MYIHMTRVSKALMGRRVLDMLKGQQRVKEQSKQEEVTAEDPGRDLTSRQIMAGHVAYTCHIGSLKVFLK